MRIASVGTAFPPHSYTQDELLAEFRRIWSGQLFNPERLEQLHRNVLVGGRHLALPLEQYETLETFGDANDAWIRVAERLGVAAVRDALERCGRSTSDIDALFFVSTTGISTPSPDARLMNRLRLSPSVRRTPIFGLGCLAGAAGIARAADYLRAYPDQLAVLLSVELCSLTLQRQDVSVANLIASGLFGDGAAAVVLAGADTDTARQVAGPAVLASKSIFYPDTEQVMGWNISERGFEVMLSAEVPVMVENYLCRDVDAFLAERGLARSDIASWVAHPGGPRVLEAMAAALELDADALEITWRTLREVGNLSSTSVLLVLEETMRTRRPEPGSHGVVLAMGPGFCSELVLLRW